MSLIQSSGYGIRLLITEVGSFYLLILATIKRVPTLFKNPHIVWFQMREIGVDSLWIVIFTAIFIGAETVVQASYQLTGLAPLSLLGFVVSKGLITELAPIITAFVVSSRVATSLAAEIGNMRLTEQLDALTTLSLDRYRYIILPRIVATTVMMPLLVIIATLFAFLSTIVVVYTTIDIPLTTYFTSIHQYFMLQDVLLTLGKSVIFGAIVGFSGVFYGLKCTGGAQGIGNATTKAVMLAALLILLADFVTALIFL